MIQNNVKPLLYFYGYEHDNPIHFLNSLKKFFLNNNIGDDFSKTQRRYSKVKIKDGSNLTFQLIFLDLLLRALFPSLHHIQLNSTETNRV